MAKLFQEYQHIILFYFMKLLYRGLDLERASVIISGLRRVAVTCRESASSCATLAGSGTITKILNGFKNIFTNNDPRYRGICSNIHVERIRLRNRLAPA